MVLVNNGTLSGVFPMLGVLERRILSFQSGVLIDGRHLYEEVVVWKVGHRYDV